MPTTIIDPHISQVNKAVLSAVVAVLSWQFALKPSVVAYRLDQKRISTLSQRLEQLEKTMQSAGGKELWLMKNKQRLSALKSRFPQQTQLPQVLNALLDALKSGDMKLLDIKQGNVQALEDTGKPLLIDGKPCLSLPINIIAEGRYHAVVAALDRISSEAFSGVVGIDQADFRLKEATTPILSANLQLLVYLVGEPAGKF